MQPTLEQLRTARDSARRRRNHNAARLRRIVLKVCARIEAYEHELALLNRVEGQIVAGGRASEDYHLPLPLSAGRTESRFDAPERVSAVITPPTPPDAPESNRRATPMPSSGESNDPLIAALSHACHGGPPPANMDSDAGDEPTEAGCGSRPQLARHFAAGDGF